MRRVFLTIGLVAPMPAARAMQQPPSFVRFQDEVAVADEAARPALVEAFVEAVRAAGAPLVEDDSTVVFVYRGDTDSVRLQGDMTFWAEPVPMERVLGTDVFFRRETVEPEARLEYLFVLPDAPSGIPDPLNPHRVLSGIGPFSELAMPGYAYPSVFDVVRDGTPGAADGLDLHRLSEGALPYGHDVLVYTPPGYADAGPRAYPTVYFLDGRDYVAFAHVPRALDALIGAGRMAPVVAVFVDPPNRHQPTLPNRMTEYGLNEAFVAFFAGEVVPFVDACYRTQTVPARRLVLGDSYGGLAALFLALRRPEVFGMGYSQSGYHGFDGGRMIGLVTEEPAAPVRLWVDVGRYERAVGTGLLPEAERDFLADNRRLCAALEKRGYDAVYREYPEGHTWGNWRAHLLDALPHFFPPEDE